MTFRHANMCWCNGSTPSLRVFDKFSLRLTHDSCSTLDYLASCAHDRIESWTCYIRSCAATWIAHCMLIYLLSLENTSVASTVSSSQGPVHKGAGCLVLYSQSQWACNWMDACTYDSRLMAVHSMMTEGLHFFSHHEDIMFMTNQNMDLTMVG